MRIDDDSQRLAQGLFGIARLDRGGQLIPAHGQGSAIGQHGFGAGEHRIVTGPQSLHVTARIRGGDPLALAARHGGAAIETGPQLDGHSREGGPHPLEKARVERFRFARQQAEIGLDPRFGEHTQATPTHLGIGIDHGRHHPRYASVDQRLGAGGSSTVMGAGFEGYIGGSTTGVVTGGAQGVNLGMGLARLLMPPFANHHAIFDQHGADAGVGGRGVAAAAGQFEGPTHPLVIILTKHSGSFDNTSRLYAVS